MRLETISTGDELIRGRSRDSNAPWISLRAAELGILRILHTTVGDDLEELSRAFAQAASRSDFVVVTGGLGPTDDDYTRRAAAHAAGADLVLRPELLSAMEERYRERGIRMPERSRAMAFLPAGATALANPLGTAPGFRLDLGGGALFFLSGVPREMEIMFEAAVLPVLREAAAGSKGAYRSLSTYGRPEAWLNDTLEDLMAGDDVTLGLTAKFGVIKVTLQATGPDAEARAGAAEAEIRRRLGDLVLEEESLPASVVRLLGERGLTLATAESCTGGLVAKLSLLGVPAGTLAEHGAVSEPVARAMAHGAQHALSADLAVAITGIAGPTGGMPEKPVGLVQFALATPDGTEATQRRLPGDRRFVRRFAANAALGMVRTKLLRGGVRPPPRS